MIFYLIQSNFALLGIERNPSKQTKTKISIVFVTLGLLVILQYVNLLLEPSTFEEYTECIYWTTTATMIFITYVIIIFKRNEMFGLIDKIERTIVETKGYRFT